MPKELNDLRNAKVRHDLQIAFDELCNAKFNLDSYKCLEELDAFIDKYDNYHIVLGYYDVTDETFIEDKILNDDSIDALMDITGATILEKLLDYHENFVYSVDVCVRLDALDDGFNTMLTVEYNGYELRLDYY